DAGDRRGGGLDGGEVDQHRLHRWGVGRQAHGDAHGDAHRPLATDERAPQVVAGRLRVEVTEQRQRPVGEHDLEGQYVRAGDAVGQAVRTTRVVGDVAPDRARLLAGGVGREMQSEVSDLARQVEVE